MAYDGDRRWPTLQQVRRDYLMGIIKTILAHRLKFKFKNAISGSHQSSIHLSHPISLL